MPLNDLTDVHINSRIRGAYREEDQFYVDNLEQPVGLVEVLQYILDNIGGGSGGGEDRYLISASLSGTTLTLTQNSGPAITVSLASLAVDQNTFVTGASLNGSNVLTLTNNDGSTVTVNLASLANATVIASNGLNDNNAGTDVDVELGGPLQRNTTVDGTDAFSMLWDNMTFYRVNAGTVIQAFSLVSEADVLSRRSSPQLFQEIRMTTPSGGDHTDAQAFMLSSNLADGESSYLGSQRPGDVAITASTSSPSVEVGFSASVVPDVRVSVRTPAVAAGTAVNGQFLRLVDENTGEVEFEDVPAGAAVSVYNAGFGFWVKGTPGIVATNPSKGAYTVTIPNGGVLESVQREFTTANDYTNSGEVLLTINWTTGAFNTSFANAVLPDIGLIDAGGIQRAPNAVAVTVSHTVASGSTTTTIANINGLGVPARIKAIL